ncbi:hypothetical protein LshimejAT787_0401560 [Lyophyllum shimeji]|uniref:Inhibitor I9 domain-containing protein n=1 Tax=Lyophyllum shimeji TaxID=47721 RepID=A0A9P3UMT0_LYOSH|nr:hypothetical protein LshimejAT787_0401560 [Lyophyllum shimeji]
MSQSRSIIVFKESASMEDVRHLMDEVKQNGGHITNVYDSLFKGFAAVMSDTQLHTLQSAAKFRSSVIDYIESDGIVTTFA